MVDDLKVVDQNRAHDHQIAYGIRSATIRSRIANRFATIRSLVANGFATPLSPTSRESAIGRSLTYG